jgi:hypothetical protein
VSQLGFRRWKVTVSGHLAALAVNHAWIPGRPEHAECQNPFTTPLPDSHEAPVFGCRCGVWAHRLPVAACGCGDPADGRHGAVGVVRMWGRHVEHEHGWRSEYAEPVALVDFTGRLARSYPARRYPDLDALYAEWAPGVAGRAPGENPLWCHRDTPVSTRMYFYPVGTTAEAAVRLAAADLSAGLPVSNLMLRHPWY